MNLKKLIYDRTYSDVVYALTHPNEDSDLKGALNVSDLNRITEWQMYLKDRLSTYGDTSQVDIDYVSSTTTYEELNLESQPYSAYVNNKYYLLCKYQGNWKEELYICWYDSFNKLVNNDNILKNILNMSNEDIKMQSKPDYLLVNNVEKILYNINVIVLNYDTIKRADTFYCGEDAIFY